MGNTIAEAISTRFKEYKEPRDRRGLRLSSVGKPARQIWYDNQEDQETVQPDSTLKLKFLYGDILEELLLFLAEEAGHTVTDKQKEVVVNGVVGHIDSKIDGVVVDCKSASPFAFKKFKEGTLFDDDPFGYIEQISGYSTAENTEGAFLAVDKVSGDLALLRLSVEDVEAVNVPDRIDYLKEVLVNSEPPEHCYDPVPDGKSGNLILPVGCAFCNHKHKCYKDANDGIGLRVFQYSNGKRYFTHIEREPNGPPEVTF